MMNSTQKQAALETLSLRMLNQVHTPLDTSNLLALINYDYEKDERLPQPQCTTLEELEYFLIRAEIEASIIATRLSKLHAKLSKEAVEAIEAQDKHAARKSKNAGQSTEGA